MNTINKFDGSTDIGELEHNKYRLKKFLHILIALYESIHDMLEDEEKTEKTEKCEELVDGAIRAVCKTDRIIKDKGGETAQLAYCTLRTHGKLGDQFVHTKIRTNCGGH
jgi:hypothetical protein